MLCRRLWYCTCCMSRSLGWMQWGVRNGAVRDVGCLLRGCRLLWERRRGSDTWRCVQMLLCLLWLRLLRRCLRLRVVLLAVRERPCLLCVRVDIR